MNLLQQLDAIFTVQAGLVFAVVMICLLCVHNVWVDYTANKAAVKRMLEEAHRMNDDFDIERALRDDLGAFYSETVVETSGYCLCGNLYVFTTTETASRDHEYCEMIACNHCLVCNPDMPAMLADNPVIDVVNEHIDGERVTFTFSDGSTAVMRECPNWGNIRSLDAPSDGGYRVDNGSQVDAIDRYTNSDCIPF